MGLLINTFLTNLMNPIIEKINYKQDNKEVMEINSIKYLLKMIKRLEKD